MVTTSSINSITCNLQARNPNTSSLLSTNSANQTNGYFSGTGLNYKRYDISGLSSKTISGFKAAIAANSASIVLAESSYRGEISTGNYYGTYYG